MWKAGHSIGSRFELRAPSYPAQIRTATADSAEAALAQGSRRQLAVALRATSTLTACTRKRPRRRSTGDPSDLTSVFQPCRRHSCRLSHPCPRGGRVPH